MRRFILPIIAVLTVLAGLFFLFRQENSFAVSLIEPPEAQTAGVLPKGRLFTFEEQDMVTIIPNGTRISDFPNGMSDAPQREPS